MSLIEQEHDVVPRGVVRAFGAMIGIGIVLSVLATLLLGHGSLGEVMRDISTPPAQIETREFPRETDEERAQRLAAERLRGYGWVDRDGGLIHVPIEVALEMYLREVQR